MLLHYLADVGVPVDSMIKLRAQDYDLWREKIKTDPQHLAALSNMPGENFSYQKLKIKTTFYKLINTTSDRREILNKHVPVTLHKTIFKLII